ncbi:MAG: RNA polymerase sigma factor [Bacillota bacterium]
MRDEEIIIHILNGKTSLYSDIVERYQNKVFSTAYGYAHDYEEAKDITQEIFIKLYNNLNKYKEQARFSTWLYRIAVNHCIDWTRKNKKNITSSFWADGENIDILDTICDEGDSPEAIVIKQEYKEQIVNTLEKLPEIYKTVLILFFMEDMNTNEIAEVLEVPKKTVETRLYRAKSMIKSILSETMLGGEYRELRQA